jgi:23S rRNA (uracil1939-C5)-methyltransferase
MKGAATEQVGVLTIDRIAAGGDGVGRLGGLAVFVPRTAPGDVVQVAYRVQGRLGRGRVLQVITPSTQRVDARCAHYERDACGGCQLQHLDAATQQQARREIVRDTLARIGRREVPLPSLVSGAEWAYRTRLTVALRRRGSGWLAGLHRHDAGARLFSLEHCEIVHPLIDATWSALRSVVERAVVALPSGETLRLSLRLIASTAPAALEDAGRDGALHATALHATAPHATGLHAGAQIHVVVQGGEAWPEQMEWQQVAQQRAPAVTQVHWVPAADADVELMVPEGPEVAEAQAFAHAFAQVNAEVADAMHQHVLHTIGGMQARHVVDGYAGTGRLSRALVEHGATVVSVELDSEAVRTMEWQHEALSAEQAARWSIRAERMESAVAALRALTADVVVLNPPRAGVHEEVTAWLEQGAGALRGVVYVSCNPATLARDLTRLPSWQVESVQCFDMFPQTAHVESVCVLRRENR